MPRRLPIHSCTRLTAQSPAAALTRSSTWCPRLPIPRLLVGSSSASSALLADNNLPSLPVIRGSELLLRSGDLVDLPFKRRIWCYLTSTRSGSACGAHRLLPLCPGRCISSLKVAWRRDAALVRDRRFRLASRVVCEVLLSPGRRLLLRYLSKRHQRIRLLVLVPTFLRRYPTLLSVSPPPDPVASPSPQLLSLLEFASHLQALYSPLLASKLLMISSTRALPVAKIAAAKRDFGLPDDFLASLRRKREKLQKQRLDAAQRGAKISTDIENEIEEEEEMEGSEENEDK